MPEVRIAPWSHLRRVHNGRWRKGARGVQGQEAGRAEPVDLHRPGGGGCSNSGHGGDASGTKTGNSVDYQTAANPPDVAPSADVPLSQVGINQLANEAGHLRVSVNFTWLLLT